MAVADLRDVVVPVRPVGEGAMGCVTGFRFTPPGAFAVRPVAAPNRPLPTTSVPPMIKSESRGTRPGGPPDDSPARERWVPSPKNIQPRQGRQNPGAVVESSIARDCPTARLLSTETGHGTDCWPARRDILAGDWARWSGGNRESATPQRPKASAGSGRGHQTPLKCRSPLRLSWINCQMDRSDPIAPLAAGRAVPVRMECGGNGGGMAERGRDPQCGRSRAGPKALPAAAVGELQP